MKIVYLCSFLFFFGCGGNKKTEKNIVARVGSETLTKENLLFLVGNQGGGADTYSRTINNWVKNKLLYNAAISIGLNKDLSLAKKRDFFYESLLISSFINIQTKKRAKTTKKEVSDYYLKNKSSFRRTDDEVVVKHFTFPTKKEAKKATKELKKKKPSVDMEDFLKKQQIQTKTIRKKEAGSNLLSFVFDSSVGDVLGPKENNKEFHVFQILQKNTKGSFLGLEQVYDEIYQRLYKEKEILILEAVVDSLRLKSDIFVASEVLFQ